MDRDVDRIPKNQETDIVIRIDEYNGKKGLTIREFVKSERYTGFTKAGTRVPADKFHLFKKAINSIDEKEFESTSTTSTPTTSKASTTHHDQTKKPADKKPANKPLTEDFDEVEF